MAMHRRPATVAVPAELIMFDPEDWPGPEWVCEWGGLDGVSWDSPFRRWQDARRAYAKEHPGSELGSVLDQLRFERRVRRLRNGWA